MITPEVVRATGAYETIVCHNDFDGLVSAAKWVCGGIEPYPGADADARAIDTCIGQPSDAASRIDRAIRARGKDTALLGLIVRHIATGLTDSSLWVPIDEAAGALEPIERETERLAQRYERLSESVALVDATGRTGPIDKTQLLLLGQQRATVSIVVDQNTATVAAAFDSGFDFVSLLGLSGGMPTRVSFPRARLAELLEKLGVGSEHRARFAR